MSNSTMQMFVRHSMYIKVFLFPQLHPGVKRKVKIDLSRVSESCEDQKCWEHPYWQHGVAGRDRIGQAKALYPGSDLLRRFTDIETSREFEEVDFALGVNQRHKIQDARQLDEPHRWDSPTHITEAIEHKRDALETDHEFKEKRQRLSASRLPTSPVFPKSMELPYEPDDPYCPKQHEPLADDDEEMEVDAPSEATATSDQQLSWSSPSSGGGSING